MRTHKLQQVNLQTKKIWDETQKRWRKVKISTKALKKINK
nr:ribosomal protein L28 [Erythrolobus coxiae]UNJ17632.1 ribosomal protein L28 [Erythrolobus coxiae]